MTTWKCRACNALMESDEKPVGCEKCGAQAEDILECLVCEDETKKEE